MSGYEMGLEEGSASCGGDESSCGGSHYGSRQITDAFGNGFEFDGSFKLTPSPGEYAVVDGGVYYIDFWYCQDKSMPGQPCTGLDVFYADPKGGKGDYVNTEKAGFLGQQVDFFADYNEAFAFANGELSCN